MSRGRTSGTLYDMPMPLLGGHFDLIPDPRRDRLPAMRCPTSSASRSALSRPAPTASSPSRPLGRLASTGASAVLLLDHGVPSHDTIRRVFALVDRRHFERSFAAWAQDAFRRTEGQVVAVDGKRLRRARATLASRC